MKKMKMVKILMALVLLLSVGVLLLLAAALNEDEGENTEAVKITIVGSTSVGPHIDALTKMYNDNVDGSITFTVEQVGSGQGIKSVQDGSADIGMSSRELKDEEKPMEEYQLCIDGIAVVVNSANPVEDISMDELRAIYMGEITNWSELGGDDATINLYTRESTSGTRGAFEELVLGEDANGEQIVIDETICAAVQNSNGQLGQGVQNDPYAIGYLSLGLVENYNVKTMSIDGVAASTENIEAGTYVISRPFLLLTLNAPEGKVSEFINWVITDADARAYLEENGFIV